MSRERRGPKKRISVVAPGLLAILDRFPDRKNNFTRLFTEDESFRRLCSDYRRCGMAVQYWKQSDKEFADLRKLEYEALQRELEGEILRYQQTFEKKKKPSG